MIKTSAYEVDCAFDAQVDQAVVLTVMISSSVT